MEKFIGPGYPGVLELQKDLSLVFLNDHHAISGGISLTPSVVPIAGVYIQDQDDPLPKVNKTKYLDCVNLKSFFFTFLVGLEVVG